MARALQILSLSMAIVLAAPVWAKETRQFQVKSEALRALKEMREQNVKRLKEIDQTLRARIEDSSAVSVEFEVNRLRVAKHEHTLRQEFLDRLIFQVDTKFSGGDLRPFLERTLTEMAKVDAASMAPNDAGLWKFLKFAAEVVGKLPEKKENILTFLEGYMNRSVANPIRPEDFMSTRNYSNGLDSESGHPLARDEVGAVADRRIRQVQEGENDQPAKPTLSTLAPDAGVIPTPPPAAEKPTQAPAPAAN